MLDDFFLDKGMNMLEVAWFSNAVIVGTVRQSAP